MTGGGVNGPHRSHAAVESQSSITAVTYLSLGLASVHLPDFRSESAATATTGLIMLASRKIESLGIGVPACADPSAPMLPTMTNKPKLPRRVHLPAMIRRAGQLARWVNARGETGLGSKATTAKVTAVGRA